MGWKTARWRRRWSDAWRSGGLGVKITVGATALLVLPGSFAWVGIQIVAPATYYPVGLSLEMNALGIALCAALPFTFVILRGNPSGRAASTVLIFLAYLAVAYIGATGALTVLNGAFDSSTPQSHTVHVLSRSLWIKSYLLHLNVTSWRPGEHEEKVLVDFDLYRSNPARVTVTTRRGALGFEWVESVTSAGSPSAQELNSKNTKY